MKKPFTSARHTDSNGAGLGNIPISGRVCGRNSDTSTKKADDQRLVLPVVLDFGPVDVFERVVFMEVWAVV